MVSLAIPNLGNYSVAWSAFGPALGLEVWTSTGTTPESLALGVAATPDSACLPFKAFTGHFIKAAKEGVEYAVMVNSTGTCRLRYYAPLQRKILKDLGLNMHVFALGFEGIKPAIVKHFDPGLVDFLKAVSRLWLKIRVIDFLELETWRVRPLELNPGDTTAVANACLDELGEAVTAGEILWLGRSIRGRFAAVPIDKNGRALKVGLVGEAAVLRDKFLNHNVEETLGNLGVEVRNFFLLGAEIRNIFGLGFGCKYSKRNQKKLACCYLRCEVGGHALDSVANTLRCAREGYDGVVHVCPTGCMPEVSIRPILRMVARDTDLPVLELSFDEHTAHVGVDTRLEAFVDILREREKGRVGRR